MRRYLICMLILSAAGCDDDNTPTAPSGPSMSFFVTSETRATGNLGGLAGADGTCQRLAAATGQPLAPGGLPECRAGSGQRQSTNARAGSDGTGPWYNAGLVIVANNLTELHSRTGDAALFLDERGQRINGQWTGSPSPVQHDILTGSNPDGTLLSGSTCSDWTSSSASQAAQVGHSDGMGPNQSTAGTLSSWNSAHPSLNCADTVPRGGAGRFSASLDSRSVCEWFCAHIRTWVIAAGSRGFRPSFPDLGRSYRIRLNELRLAWCCDKPRSRLR